MVVVGKRGPSIMDELACWHLLRSERRMHATSRIGKWMILNFGRGQLKRFLPTRALEIWLALD
jgi:hypothetical protein